MSTMCEAAGILEVAAPSELPILAHLSLELHLIALHKFLTLLLSVEVLLRFLHSCQLIVPLYSRNLLLAGPCFSTPS